MKYTFKVFFISSFLFLSHSLIAQPGPGQGRMGGAGRGPSIGGIYGKVQDASSKEAIEYATLTLLAANKDSVISGGLTQGNGDFSLDKLPMGRYRLRIQYLGYKTLFHPVFISTNTIEQDLGNLKLE